VNKVTSILLATRPKTLTAAVVPIAVALGYLQRSSVSFEYWPLGLALFATIFIQIGTNFINDWADFKKGADSESRIGPKRATQQGWLSEKTVLFLGVLAFLIAMAIGVPIVLHGGVPILIIGLVSVVFGYAYTAGPFPLAYLGLGELFVIIFFGLVAVAGSVFLVSHQWLIDAFVLGIEVGLLSTSLIAINNYRDSEEDRKVGKNTLAVRWGAGFSKVEIAFCLLAPFAMHALYFGFSEANWLVFLPMPLALLIAKKVFTEKPSEKFNKYLGMSAGLQLLFSLLYLVGSFV
jgi:1,4-dihydroxy-2-naphthoate octaprenyltransferase